MVGANGANGANGRNGRNGASGGRRGQSANASEHGAAPEASPGAAAFVDRIIVRHVAFGDGRPTSMAKSREERRPSTK